MKAIILCALILFSISLSGQNTGINKTNPTQPLDVNGNVNIDGKLIMNGVQGTSGQVLRTATNGATQWISMGEFTYMVSYDQNGSFVVPAGITKVFVEIWGAGGGGSSGGGGAAGTYIQSVQNVIPGASLTITIGSGGPNATVFPGAATDGENSVVSGFSPSITMTALGGKGAGSNSPGYPRYYILSGHNYVQFEGQAGEANTFTYAQKNATTFAIIRKYGDGGASGPNYLSRNQGETRSINESTGTTTLETNIPTFAPVPGGGGGGGNFGKDGAKGRVVIRY